MEAETTQQESLPDVAFVMTPQDVLLYWQDYAVSGYLRPPPFWKRFLAALFLPVVCIFLSLVLLATLAYLTDSVGLASLILMGLAIGTVYLYADWVGKKPWRRACDEAARRGNSSIFLHPVGFTQRWAKHEWTIYWPAISDVVTGEHCIMVFTNVHGQEDCISIPYRAFSTPEHQQAFVEKIHSRRENNRVVALDTAAN